MKPPSLPGRQWRKYTLSTSSFGRREDQLGSCTFMHFDPSNRGLATPEQAPRNHLIQCSAAQVGTVQSLVRRPTRCIAKFFATKGGVTFVFCGYPQS
jgi:hypothetical protein